MRNAVGGDVAEKRECREARTDGMLQFRFWQWGRRHRGLHFGNSSWKPRGSRRSVTRRRSNFEGKNFPLPSCVLCPTNTGILSRQQLRNESPKNHSWKVGPWNSWHIRYDRIYTCTGRGRKILFVKFDVFYNSLFYILLIKHCFYNNSINKSYSLNVEL